MSKKPPSVQLKRGLLLFWGLWFLIVFLTNLFDLFRIWGLLGPHWPAVSDYYLLVQKATSIYHLPVWVIDFFFNTIVLWEAICSAFFLHAWLVFGKDADRSTNSVYKAFGFAIALFAAFILSCEVFLVYEIEGVHMRVLTALLVSFLAVRILPE